MRVWKAVKCDKILHRLLLKNAVENRHRKTSFSSLHFENSAVSDQNFHLSPFFPHFHRYNNYNFFISIFTKNKRHSLRFPNEAICPPKPY